PSWRPGRFLDLWDVCETCSALPVPVAYFLCGQPPCLDEQRFGNKNPIIRDRKVRQNSNQLLRRKVWKSQNACHSRQIERIDNSSGPDKIGERAAVGSTGEIPVIV